ncbi:MAG: hypothetical protein EOR86_04955 [Mesorhizobium sp.]|uniref:hypothetical protein n=1 Tax=Mesorhizobium sp. TaxID=1871066 RepID=UPI000FE52329|nr:hypothetical protein [Mesorhizobium sp.]RWM98975.1 MAG: hypothetical protein EOR86_04955 [Mesorhizobium sp.]
MKNKSDVERLEKVIGQLQGAHSEISLLAKKSPNDSLNKFKLNLINKVLESANQVLGEKYSPFPDFTQFDADDVPTTSDVTMVLSQYMEEAERYRSDNVVNDYGWKYVVDGKVTEIPAGPPSKVGRK